MEIQDNPTAHVDAEEDLRVAERIVSIAMDALLLEMKGCNDHKILNPGKKIGSRHKNELYKIRMTLWEIWYFLVGIHLRGEEKSCKLEVNALRKVLLSRLEEMLLSSPLNDRPLATTSQCKNSDGLSVEQQSTGLTICKCHIYLSQNKRNMQDVILCGSRYCLAPHHLLYCLKGDQGTLDVEHGDHENDDENENQYDCDYLRKGSNEVHAESDVTDNLVQQLQELWPE